MNDFTEIVQTLVTKGDLNELFVRTRKSDKHSYGLN